MRRWLLVAAMSTTVALGFRLFLALHLPNDDDDDGRFYSQIARNLIDSRGYSGESEEPFVPTYVRVPGYPLFLAGVYSIFGRTNDTAVRIIQALLDTLTCWLVALLAVAWVPSNYSREKRRRVMLIALALAAICPFNAVYVSTILTETWATLLVVLLLLLASIALKASNKAKSYPWFFAGLIGGMAAMFRPDCAIFSGGVGVILLITGASRIFGRGSSTNRLRPSVIFATTLVACASLCAGFVLALAPWTIRNVRVFGIFQPVAPKFANMPNEFLPLGYISWLRTWINDERYVGPAEDTIGLYPIDIDKMPDSAFDSEAEREQVELLLDRYNNPPKPEPTNEGEEPPEILPRMTAEIDSVFGEIAAERITRHPFRYYALLPVERAGSLWFDTHSQYYPFQGEIFPLEDLDTDHHQQYWLSLFAGLIWFYTIVGLIGAWVLWKAGSTRWWVFLLVLSILPRLAFLAAQEHPEARYTVEFLPIVAAAGSLALANLSVPKGIRAATLRIRRRGSAASTDV